MTKNKQKPYVEKEDDFMIQLCRYINETHAGYSGDRSRIEDRCSSLPGNNMFQDVKSLEEFGRHFGDGRRR